MKFLAWILTIVAAGLKTTSGRPVVLDVDPKANKLLLALELESRMYIRKNRTTCVFDCFSRRMDWNWWERERYQDIVRKRAVKLAKDYFADPTHKQQTFNPAMKWDYLGQFEYADLAGNRARNLPLGKGFYQGVRWWNRQWDDRDEPVEESDSSDGDESFIFREPKKIVWKEISEWVNSTISGLDLAFSIPDGPVVPRNRPVTRGVKAASQDEFIESEEEAEGASGDQQDSGNDNCLDNDEEEDEDESDEEESAVSVYFPGKSVRWSSHKSSSGSTDNESSENDSNNEPSENGDDADFLLNQTDSANPEDLQVPPSGPGSEERSSNETLVGEPSPNSTVTDHEPPTDVPTGGEKSEADEEEGEYVVRAIKRHRINKTKKHPTADGLEFLVSWVGYKASDDSWLPMANLAGARQLVDAYLKSQNLRMVHDKKTGKYSLDMAAVSSKGGPGNSMPNASVETPVDGRSKNRSEEPGKAPASKGLRRRNPSSASTVSETSPIKATKPFDSGIPRRKPTGHRGASGKGEREMAVKVVKGPVRAKKLAPLDPEPEESGIKMSTPNRTTIDPPSFDASRIENAANPAVAVDKCVPSGRPVKPPGKVIEPAPARKGRAKVGQSSAVALKKPDMPTASGKQVNGLAGSASSKQSNNSANVTTIYAPGPPKTALEDLQQRLHHFAASAAAARAAGDAKKGKEMEFYVKQHEDLIKGLASLPELPGFGPVSPLLDSVEAQPEVAKANIDRSIRHAEAFVPIFSPAVISNHGDRSMQARIGIISRHCIVVDSKNPAWTPMDRILAVSACPRIVPMTEVLDRDYTNLVKIGEASNADCYKAKHKGETIIIKVIAVDGVYHDNSPQPTTDQLQGEIIISQAVQRALMDEKSRQDLAPVFVKTAFLKVARGKYDKKFTDAHNKFARKNAVQIQNPDTFSALQTYIVIGLHSGGQPLEDFESASYCEILSIIRQIGLGMAVSETRLHFEQRNLSEHNIWIRRIHECGQVDFWKAGGAYVVNTRGVVVTIMDYTMARMKHQSTTVYNDMKDQTAVFDGQGEGLYDVYRRMKHDNSNNWKPFAPHSNLLWLRYLRDKLMAKMAAKKGNHFPTETDRNAQAFAVLRDLFPASLTVNSACDLVDRSEAFKDCKI